MNSHTAPFEPGMIQCMAALDWQAIRRDLDLNGCALVPKLLSAETCGDLASLYGQDDAFRSRVVMVRHGFGKGEYKYFAYPLPTLIQDLRSAIYPHGVSRLHSGRRHTLGVIFHDAT